jgi:hypothetical protein
MTKGHEKKDDDDDLEFLAIMAGVSIPFPREFHITFF